MSKFPDNFTQHDAAGDTIRTFARCKQRHLGFVTDRRERNGRPVWRGVHVGEERLGRNWESVEPNVVGRTLEDLRSLGFSGAQIAKALSVIPPHLRPPAT